MRLITTNDLEHWSGSRAAQSRFPHIVKDLICAVIQPHKLRMPSVDAVWLPGFDGEVLCDKENRFVPLGKSVWELGTGKDSKQKANDDYDKRSEEKSGNGGEREKRGRKLDRNQITFVFVTPRIWRDKEDWVAERKLEGVWRDVKVLDGVDLQDWLEAAPAVHLALAAEIGRTPEEGLKTLGQAWDEWSHLTRPPTSKELVVVGREQQEKELIGRLAAPPSTFVVRGASPREAWGFTLAALRRVGSEDDRVKLTARTLVAKNEEVAGRLRNLGNLIIVIEQAQSQVSGFLFLHGCHVVVPEGNDGGSSNAIVLTRPETGPFMEALERAGLSADEAGRITRECSRNITVFQRRCAHANFERPPWADGKAAIQLQPALLAGRWSDRSEADREILCRLAGAADYHEVTEQLEALLWVAEPPIQKIGEMWTLTATVDAFELTARRLTSRKMELFKAAFREVFGTIDPKVELPPDEWMLYDLKGEQGHSGWLRSGMAETLLLMVERGPHAGLSCVGSRRAYVNEVVRGLPGLRDDWRVLASLRDEYARLMEAAPDPLLDSLEHLLGAKPEDVRRLFTDSGDLLFGGGNMHTGLLWGLETLAWSPDHLSRVALILARLARIDPGGHLSNRPFNSLRDIFLWWKPGTYASTAERLVAVDLILKQEPDVGWKLLAGSLPFSAPRVTGSTAKPRWRSFRDLPQESFTQGGTGEYVNGLIHRALAHLGADPERWRQVLESVRAFDEAQRAKLVSQLREVVEEIETEQDRFELWQVVRELVATHESFQAAGEEGLEGLIHEVKPMVATLAPGNAIERNQWLFDKWDPRLPERGEGFEKYKSALREARQKAVREVLDTEGRPGLVRLGTTCEASHFVASAAVSLLDLAALFALVEEAIAAGETGVSFAGQVSEQAEARYGAAWCELIHEKAGERRWPPLVTASLMALWPEERPTWERVRELGEEVEAEYWRRTPVRGFDGSPEDLTYRADRLIEAGRAGVAFRHFSYCPEKLLTEALVRLFDAALGDLEGAKTGDEVRRLGLGSSDVKAFLAELRKRPELQRKEVARREFRALAPLGWGDIEGLALHEIMAASPNFFVEVLSEAFLPRYRDKSLDAESTPEAQARAQSCYRLLEGMSRIPGKTDEDQIDEEVLLAWVGGVREAAAKADRSAIAEQYIGKILARAPADPKDHAWPHEVVRNVIDELAAEEVEKGLRLERFNMRGVHSRGLYQGGDQERELAGQYRGWAETCAGKWPRMRRVLSQIAESWEEDARREDQHAEQRKEEDG